MRSFVPSLEPLESRCNPEAPQSQIEPNAAALAQAAPPPPVQVPPPRIELPSLQELHHGPVGMPAPDPPPTCHELLPPPSEGPAAPGGGVTTPYAV